MANTPRNTSLMLVALRASLYGGCLTAGNTYNDVLDQKVQGLAMEE